VFNNGHQFLADQQIRHAERRNQPPVADRGNLSVRSENAGLVGTSMTPALPLRASIVGPKIGADGGPELPPSIEQDGGLGDQLARGAGAKNGLDEGFADIGRAGCLGGRAGHRGAGGPAAQQLLVVTYGKAMVEQIETGPSLAVKATEAHLNLETPVQKKTVVMV
jgi:hypothetical protein